LAPSIGALALAALVTADPESKATAAHRLAAGWRDAEAHHDGIHPPDRPARPDRPQLARPGDMPKRRALSTVRGRVALLHALAHIEFNAIDLACDIVARFAGLPRGFYRDWIAVADDEARHFEMLRRRLNDLGTDYGDLPAHDGLWQAAEDTADDLLARLAVVPLVLEARGLDVTPAMIARLDAAGDTASAEILRVIYREEIAHVAAGSRWFLALCAERGLEPAATWRDIVATRFKGALKPPFNDDARLAAGMPAGFYQDEHPDGRGCLVDGGNAVSGRTDRRGHTQTTRHSA
jgi:uncharacterized ferritin-like protein (DUF455 family)